MKLKTLFKDFPEVQIKGSKELEITGVTSSSKLVGPGNLFIAKKGLRSDGSQFIPEAISNGAVAIVTDIYDPTLKQITQVVCPMVAKLEGKIAACFYQHSSHKLFMVGVTGTNGKTTTTFAIKHLLDRCDCSCGLIGTIEYVVGSKRYTASRTTPDVCANHKLLCEMQSNGCKGCVMEVTSHALDQGRVDSVHFDVAIFSNLSHEHLDYHHNMDEYFLAKAKLFKGLDEKSVAIVNADDPWAIKVKNQTKARLITFGITNRADLVAKDIVFNPSGTTFTCEYQDQSVSFHWPLVGRFNVYNALSAIGVGLMRGLSLSVIADHLKDFRSAPGRLEAVPNALGVQIYVDYAHKPEALRNVLETLKELARGKIITVFGCGGDRDREKRPLMAKVSEELSDMTIVTSDNPRSEAPEKIIQEIVTGFRTLSGHQVEIDRKKAIAMAIEQAKEHDIILIAGKGHEAKQIFASHIIDFDDKLVAQDLAESLLTHRGKS